MCPLCVHTLTHTHTHAQATPWYVSTMCPHTHTYAHARTINALGCVCTAHSHICTRTHNHKHTLKVARGPDGPGRRTFTHARACMHPHVCSCAHTRTHASTRTMWRGLCREGLMHARAWQQLTFTTWGPSVPAAVQVYEEIVESIKSLRASISC